MFFCLGHVSFPVFDSFNVYDPFDESQNNSISLDTDEYGYNQGFRSFIF
jgi:hypothetical protein